MRYVLPLVVCAAIGALIIVLFEMRGDPPSPIGRGETETDEPARKADPAPAKGERNTPTSLAQNKWLSELERAMQREDLNRALYFRQRVCEDIDKIVADDELRKNLFDLIRANGPGSDDPRRRDVALPMLRVIQHPEATQLIAEEYYRAKTPEEQMVLLEAMSHSYHDPKQAAVWAVERALNAESQEHRERAFEVIERNSGDPGLVLDTAFQIYESTTRPKQSDQVLFTITSYGRDHKRVRDFVRGKLKRPRANEIMKVLHNVEAWGTERDAAQLEALAEEFPGLGNMLRDTARRIREGRQAEKDAENTEDVPDPGRPIEPVKDE